MSAKGTLGWVILAVALAVPAFMAWNWWQNMNVHKPEVRLKPNAAVFGGTSATKSMSNPLATASTGARPAQSWTTPGSPVPPGVAGLADAKPFPGGQASDAGRAAAGPDGPATASSEKSTAQKPGTASPAASPAPAGQSTLPAASSPAAPPLAGAQGTAALPVKAPAAQASASSESADAGEFNPKTERDPTLSPGDRLFIKKRQWEKDHPPELAKPVVGKRIKIVKPRAPPEPPIETRIDVAGTIMVQNAVPTAIINGEIHKQGDTVLGAKVMKITPSGVLFSYRKGVAIKTFMKTVKK